MRIPRVLTYAEGNTEAPVLGEDMEIRRSHQAVSCKKRYAEELRRPQRVPVMGKPDDGTILEPNVLDDNHEPGRSDDSTKKDQSTICSRGVLSGIVLRGWESQPQKGPDRSISQGHFLRGAQPAKET